MADKPPKGITGYRRLSYTKGFTRSSYTILTTFNYYATIATIARVWTSGQRYSFANTLGLSQGQNQDAMSGDAMTEHDLQEQVQLYLSEKGIYYFHLPRNIGRKRGQTSGILDLMCIGHGKIFFLELKHPEKKVHEWKVSKKQEEFMQLLKKNNIPYLISNYWEAIKEFIDNIIKGG